ncbi:MAG: hypothetical protein Q9173_003344 [Seirophora scorigena]
MGEFMQLCKKIFLLKKSASKADQASKRKSSRRLGKKGKQTKEPTPNQSSAPTGQGQDAGNVNQQISPRQEPTPRRTQKDTGAGSNPQPSSPKPPLTPPNPCKRSSPQEPSTEESTTIRDSLLGCAVFSTRTSLTIPKHESSTIVVCELPADLPPSPPCERLENAPANASSIDSVRYQEFKHWGVIAPEIRRHRLVEEGEMREWDGSHGTVARGPRVADPEVTPSDTLGVFERSVEGGAHGNMARILKQDRAAKRESAESLLPTKGESKEPLAENTEAYEKNLLADNRSPVSETSTEHLLLAREQSVKSEDSEDLEDEVVSDLKATITTLNTTIKALEAKAQKATSHKEMAQKIGKKKVEAKEKELAQQEERLESARSEIASKEAEIDAARSRIASLEVDIQRCHDHVSRLERWGKDTVATYSQLHAEYSHVQTQQVIPLQQEVARLTSRSLEQHQHASLQHAHIAMLEHQIQSHPSIPQLQSDLVSAATQLERYKAIAAHTLGELQEAQDTVEKQHAKLCSYRAECEDFPVHGAHTDGLLQAKDERYRSLEMKANKAYLQMKEMKAHHEHEKIMLKAKQEDTESRVNNLERCVSLAEEETDRLSGIVCEYVEAGAPPGEVLRRWLAASEKTVEDLKSRFRFQSIQLANLEKALVEQRAEVQVRDLWLSDKDSALNAAREESKDAQNALDDRELQSAFEKQTLEGAVDASNEELAATGQKLQLSKDTIEELVEDLRALAQSSDAAKVAELRRIQIDELRERVQELEAQLLQEPCHNGQMDAQRPAGDHEAEAELRVEHEADLQARQHEWQDAQSQIRKLQNHIALTEQGCDPEKFEIFEKCVKLELVRDGLMEEKQATSDRLEALEKEMAATFQDARSEFQDRDEKIRALVQLVQMMAANLKEAWFGGGDRMAGAVGKQEVFEYVEEVVREMLIGNVTKEDDDDDEQDRDGQYEVEEPVQDEEPTDPFDDAESDGGSFNVPHSRIPEPEDSGSTHIPSYSPSASSAPSAHFGAENPGLAPDASEEEIDAYLDTLLFQTPSTTPISEDEAALQNSLEKAYGPAEPIPAPQQNIIEDVEAEIISPEAPYSELNRLVYELGMVAVYPSCVEWGNVWCYAKDWERTQRHADNRFQQTSALGYAFDYDEGFEHEDWEGGHNGLPFVVYEDDVC